MNSKPSYRPFTKKPKAAAKGANFKPFKKSATFSRLQSMSKDK